MEYAAIEKALFEGVKLHSFRSGGGLRVVTLEKEGKSVAYGEHPYMADALMHANQDYLDGGLTYEQLYSGQNAKYRHYLTGAAPTGHDELDTWISRGNVFDAYVEEEIIVCKLIGYTADYEPGEKVGHGKTLQEALKQALAAEMKQKETM